MVESSFPSYGINSSDHSPSIFFNLVFHKKKVLIRTVPKSGTVFACKFIAQNQGWPNQESKVKMESWLLDVKRMKIPRPKFSGKYPMEPPKDYSSEDLSKEDKRTAASFLTARNMVKATEDLRRELQDKL